MVKVITERPARPIPQGYSVAGVDDGDDGTDWEPPPNAGATREWELWNEGGDPLVQPHGNFGATETIDPADGNVHTGTVNADCTVTLSATSGTAGTLILELTNSGVHTLAFAGSVTEIGTRDDTDGVTYLGVAYTSDSGASWVVYWIGGSGSGGTPATTVESETTFGISPAVGTDTEYARQDHTHGTPANPVSETAIRDLGHWEVVVSGSGPPVAVSTPSDDDWVYAWVPG